MLHKVKNFIIEHDLLKKGDAVVLGVSGGPDSMALLHILAALRSELGIRVVAAHLNHGIRAEAGEEEEKVSRICRKLQVEYFSARKDIPALARQNGQSLEEAGREARYQFFREVYYKVEADVIATAHHKDDSAETVLLHLLRGSGIKGLRGIFPRSGVLIRPLLGVDKHEIMIFLEEQGIEFCQDQSNQDLRYTRNRIRSLLLPLLKNQFNGQIVENLNQLANIAREENLWLEEMTADIFGQLVEQQNDHTIILDSPALQDKPIACQRRVLIMALASLSGESGWELKDIEKIRSLQNKSGSRRSVPLKKGLIARKVYDKLILTSHTVSNTSFCCKIDCLPAHINIPEIGKSYYFYLTDEIPSIFGGATLVDYEDLQDGNLYLRSRLPGDRIRPAGGRGSKKIKDYFIDRKLPWEERSKIPLLASDSEVYAIIGFCAAEKARIKSSSRQILVIKSGPLADN